MNILQYLCIRFCFVLGLIWKVNKPHPGRGKNNTSFEGSYLPHLSRSLWWHHRNLSYLRSLCHALGSPWTSFRLSRTLLPPTYTRHLRQGSRRSFRNPSKTTAWREDAGRLADGSSFTDKERHESYLAVPKPETGRRQHHILEGTAVRPAPKRNTLATHSDFRRHRSENLDARGKVKKYKWEGEKNRDIILDKEILKKTASESKIRRFSFISRLPLMQIRFLHVSRFPPQLTHELPKLHQIEEIITRLWILFHYSDYLFPWFAIIAIITTIVAIITIRISLSFCFFSLWFHFFVSNLCKMRYSVAMNFATYLEWIQRSAIDPRFFGDCNKYENNDYDVVYCNTVLNFKDRETGVLLLMMI